MLYYFAVVSTDSAETAAALYQACEGVEVEGTANVLDLRFIPDDLAMETPLRDEATEIPTNYSPPDYSTQSLRHTNPVLTWDMTNPRRLHVTTR
jgi:hypothetical protein